MKLGNSQIPSLVKSGSGKKEFGFQSPADLGNLACGICKRSRCHSSEQYRDLDVGVRSSSLNQKFRSKVKERRQNPRCSLRK